MKGLRMDWVSWAILVLTISISALTFYKSSRDKDNQIARQKEIIGELQNLITGGDGYIFIRPTLLADNKKAFLSLEFNGKYPLYDVSIATEDFNLVPVEGKKDSYIYKKSGQRYFQLGTVSPLQNGNTFEVIELPDDKESQFGRWHFLKIVTRNLLIEQDIFIRKEGPQYSLAYKVITHSPNYESLSGFSLGTKDSRAILRHVDPGFPVHQLPQDNLKGSSGWCTKFEKTTGVDIMCDKERE